ncbi:MAG TPA: FKBP-type peptidyl-prolyl cis-trans isomerase [Rhizomicrobium sp.]|jgi:FKBP-type peptidyl-prolyl cis-trans isomerase FklB|nr:FKBP-type peptidyl-prolyl cis-trans isomerase [Rhizomicrobium sp.]
MKHYGAVMAAALTALVSLATIDGAQAADPALSQAANAAYLEKNAHNPGVVVRPSGLQYNIIRSGFGQRPRPTDEVDCYYTGTLINGKMFDGTEPLTPAHFTVNKLIPGWTEALQLMRVGDKWHIVIPANLAYGARGAGDGVIPPNQALVFDMELLTVTHPKQPPPGQDPDDPDAGQQ